MKRSTNTFSLTKKSGPIYKHLQNVPKRRRKRYNSQDSRGRLAGKGGIDEQPEIINTREKFGPWEGDTVIGKDKHHGIVTLEERKTGFLIIKRLRLVPLKK